MAIRVTHIGLAAFLVGCGTRNLNESYATASSPVADLGFVTDRSQRPAIGVRQLTLRNRAHKEGAGIIVLSLLDSAGRVSMTVPVDSGRAIRVPAATLGGLEGRVVPVRGSPELETAIDSLIRADASFAVRATIRTVGGDADASDNVRTREWRSWTPMRPQSAVAFSFAFDVPSARRAFARIDAVRIPPGVARIASPSLPRVLGPGHHDAEVRVITSKDLPHGSVCSFRLTVFDSATQDVLHQTERVAVYDTVPPALISYRAIVLRDGRIAVQAYAGDAHAGLSERAVAAHFSVDGGKTWRREVHDYAEDDFGRPSIFEVVLGPFSAEADLLLGVSARDLAGNLTFALPDDAAGFLAPEHAERVLDLVGLSLTDGKSIFAPEIVNRLAELSESAAQVLTEPTAEQARRVAIPTAQFDLRRERELDVVPSLFRAASVDPAKFQRLNVRRADLSPDGGGKRAFLHLQVPPR